MGAEGTASKEKGAVVELVGTEVVMPKFITGGGAGNFVSFRILEDAKKLGGPPLDAGGGAGVIGGTITVAGTFGSGVGTRTGDGGIAIVDENGWLDISFSSLLPIVNVMAGGFGEES